MAPLLIIIGRNCWWREGAIDESKLVRAVNKQSCYQEILGSARISNGMPTPNIVFAIGKMSKYASPCHIHWNIVHKILKYLKETINYGIWYNRYPIILEEYIDAS